MNKFMISVIFFILANSIFLYINKKLYTKQIIKIQRVMKTTNITSYILAQIAILFGYYYFVVIPNRTAFDAFIYGLAVYGYYHFINMASFKHWQLRTIIIDTVWGSGLFYFTRLLIH